MPSKDRFNLVVGLAGPYGSGCSSVATEFERKVEDWPGCHVVKIRVSELIAKWYPIIIKEDLPEAGKGNEKRRILQKAGTRLRDHDVEIIGKIVSFEVRRNAVELESSGFLKDKDILVFIVDSLKNRNDVKTLERIYGDEFYFCFIHANLEFRWRRMIDYKSWQEGERAEFQELDKIDSNEKDVRPEVGDTGQQVKLLAQMADYFIVNNINREKLRNDVDRFLNLLIGNGPNQPTIHERSMHMAFSASNRSCCLSRQVGAAIFDNQGSLIGIGHNDVPKAGGSLYALEDQSDSRCFVMGDLRCINETNKQERFDKLSDRICERLKKQAGEGRLNEFIKQSEFKDGTDFRHTVQAEVEKSDFKDATEFCRAVHAEMEAILSVGRKSHGSTLGATMYVTTEPCHNCTKHIICAGITKVIFIEPYPKSLARELHSDAVKFDPGEETVKGKVVFIPYHGTAPHRFHEFFWMLEERKNDRGIIITKTKQQRAEKPRFAQRISKRSRLRTDGNQESYNELMVAFEFLERYLKEPRAEGEGTNEPIQKGK